LPLLLPGISRDPRARQSLSSRPWDASSASRPNRSNWPAPGLLSKSPAWAVDVALSANEDVQNSGLSRGSRRSMTPMGLVIHLC
jgi:hypothetical protein